MNTFDKNSILFSRTVKAGKRVYYIDVKQTRRGELYLALTESKRVQDGTELVPPVFEKHKIFLYSEDFEKFGEAFHEALAFVEGQGGCNFTRQAATGAEADGIAKMPTAAEVDECDKIDEIGETDGFGEINETSEIDASDTAIDAEDFRLDVEF